MKASCYQSLGTLPETTSLKKILFSSPLAINCTQLCRRVGAMNLPWPCCAGSHSSQVMSHSNSAPCLFLWLSHAFFSHLCNAPWTSERVIWKSTYGWALKMPFDIIYLTFWKILLSVLSNRGENQLIDVPRTQQRYMSQGQKPWEPGDALHTTAQKKKKGEKGGTRRVTSQVQLDGVHSQLRDSQPSNHRHHSHWGRSDWYTYELTYFWVMFWGVLTPTYFMPDSLLLEEASLHA